MLVIIDLEKPYLTTVSRFAGCNIAKNVYDYFYRVADIWGTPSLKSECFGWRLLAYWSTFEMPLFSTKEQEPKKIETTVHLQKLTYDSRRKLKAQRAIKEIVKAGQTIMGTKEVKIDQELNSRIWYRSRANPPPRVRVLFERKADDNGKMITTASYVDVPSFKGLITEKKE